MRKIRLFLAVNLSDEIKTNIGEFKGYFKDISLDCKWVKEENLHLTIKFFGEVSVDLVPAIVTTIQNASLAIEPFQISFTGLGFFPNDKRPRILWTGIEGQVGGLINLHEKLVLALSPLGFPPERRKYSPHLTILRLRSQRNIGLLKGLIDRMNNENVELGVMTVNTIELMQSRLTPEGPVYSVLNSFPLYGK